MEQKKRNLVTLGSTGITVEKNSFGALPIQRISKEAAIGLLRKAYAAGVTFYDTARYYTDSEEKVGAAFDGMRDKIYIATKTGATTTEGFWKELHTSLEKLKTDYIDIYQFHNPAFCPKPGDGTGLYEAMLEAKDKGMIRHIGIMKPLTADCMRLCSSLSVIWRRTRIWSWYRIVKKQAWDLSP